MLKWLVVVEACASAKGCKKFTEERLNKTQEAHSGKNRLKRMKGVGNVKKKGTG